MISHAWWPYEFAGSTRNASAEMKSLFDGEKAFETPKPERLIMRVLQIASNPGDLVLDSFLGSGTTAAVAHKMGRRWVGVEVGSHAENLCAPRFRKVVDGENGGISIETDWHGGGGFRFYRLAPSLLERDKWGNWVVSKQYNKEMLAEAMCKLEGFTYAPSPSLFWMHGQSTERDYIFVTTQTLSHEQLHAIAEDVGPERSLLICCSAFKGKVDQFQNLTVKKIPATVLARCEWGKDDYSLNVASVTGQEPEEPATSAGPTGSGPDKSAPARRGRKPKSVQEMPLFAPRGEK